MTNFISGCQGAEGDYEDERDDSDDRHAIPIARRQRRPATELKRFDLENSDVDSYEGKDGDDADADADEEKQTLQADAGSTQNVED
jgi:hypothetical protein